MTLDRCAEIQSRLRQSLAPLELDVRDDSAAHAAHAGARDGRGHFTVRIVSSAFERRPRIERHRMVYAALSDLMQTDIHALSITALTPEEIH